MGCTETLKAHVSPEIKNRAKSVAERDFLSEGAWLKRLVLREIGACDAAQGGEAESSREEGNRRPGRQAPGPNGCAIEDRGQAPIGRTRGSAGNAASDLCVCSFAITPAQANAPA
jgi:hypothetical protein